MIPILAILVGLGSLVCWIIVLIKIFQESVGLGILALICPLFAFIYGWTKVGQYGIQNLMVAWTILIVVGIVLNISMGGMNRMPVR